MSEDRRTLLSIGAFFIVLVVSLLLAFQVFNNWTLTFPLVLLLYGIWILALAVIRSGNAGKYERGAFSTASMGLLLVAVGGGWMLIALGLDWLYALALILLVLAGLAIAAAMRRK
jgi:hypothetical protein